MEGIKTRINTKVFYVALLVIAAISLPQLFHLSKAFGPTFLPMHIPVLIAGFMLGPVYGLAVRRSFTSFKYIYYRYAFGIAGFTNYDIRAWNLWYCRRNAFKTY